MLCAGHMTRAFLAHARLTRFLFSLLACGCTSLQSSRATSESADAAVSAADAASDADGLINSGSTDSGLGSGDAGSNSAFVADAQVGRSDAAAQDEAKCDLAGCDPHAACSVSEGEALCACQSPYIGAGTQCTFDSACSALDCDADADCIVDGTSRSCVCREGFTGSGESCTNIDECLRAPCGPNQRCTDSVGSYQCTCRTTSQCPTGAGSYCDGTAEYSCSVDSDGCLVAGPNTSCNASDECQEPLCTPGTGCGERPRNGRTPCSGGVCDGAGHCVECVVDGDCGNGLVCDTSARCVVPRCGDGLVTKPMEQCDPAAPGTASDTWHCSPDCKERTAYTACSASACDASSSCQTGAMGRAQCLPLSGLGLDGVGLPSARCPTLAGSYTQKFWSNAYCVIECSTPADCPAHLSLCIDSPFAGAGTYEAARYCVAP